MEATSVARPHGLRLARPRRVLAAFSDERLVDQVRRGDQTAFEVLYDRHHRPVLAFCRHMLRSADEAEDAVQHAFIAAYNDLQRSGEREIRFKAWLYAIARNRCLSMLRARREEASDDVEITVDRLSEDVQQRADLQALLADIHELPGDQREALVLSEVGDLSHAEVAQIVGCEVSKVKSLVFQARTALVERRQARDMPCSEIREQLATLRGGALRRSSLRHHVSACPGCTEYRDQIKRQRQMLALALPVVPSLGLRGHVLSAVGIGGGGAGAGGAGLGAGLAAKSTLAKLGIAALVAGAGAGTTVVATHGGLPHISGSSGSSVAPAATATPAADAATQAATDGATGNASQPGGTGAAHRSTGSAQADHSRSTSGSEHGFTPVAGGSNGARAREFAATRGKGRHTGLTKTHRTTAHSRRVHTRHRAPTVTVKQLTRRAPAPQPRTTAPKTQTAPTPTETTQATTPPSTTPVPAPGGGQGGGGQGGGGKGKAGGLGLPAGG